MNFGGYGRDIHSPPYIFCFLFKKTEKVQYLYLNQILHHFDLKKNPRMNNKHFMKRGPAPISLQSENSSSIDFTAILLTPGIFLIQIIQMCI